MWTSFSSSVLVNYKTKEKMSKNYKIYNRAEKQIIVVLVKEKKKCYNFTIKTVLYFKH